MAMTDEDRRQLLAGLGLEPDGEALTKAATAVVEQEVTTVAPVQDAPAIQTPVRIDIPDLTSLSDEELTAPGAFDRLKLNAKDVGRATSSPHNRLLHRLVCEAVDRKRRTEQAGRREAKANKGEGFVQGKVRGDTTERAATMAAEAVLQILREQGVIQ